MTTVEIEGVIITPEVHEALKCIQEFESFLGVIESAEVYILDDSIERSSERTLVILRELHFLKKMLSNLIPSHEPN